MRAVVANTPAVIYVKSAPDLRFAFVNPRFESLFGLAPGEAVGKRDEDFLPVDIARLVRAHDLRVLDTGKPVCEEETIPVRDELRVYISIKFPLFDSGGVPRGVCGISTDITEAKVLERELARSQEQLAEAQRVAHIGSWEWRVAEDKIFWSDELCRIHGLEPGFFPPTYEEYLAAVHPDDLERVRGIIEASFRSGDPFHYESRVVRPDGSVRVVECHGEVLLTDAGEPEVLRGTSQDITERFVAHLDLEQREARFRAVFDQSLDGKLIVDDDRRILEVNRAACSLLSIADGELVGRRLDDLVAPKQGADVAEAFLGQGRQSGELDLLRADGTRVPVDYSARAKVMPGRHLTVLRDISDRRKADQDRRKADQALRESEQRYRNIVETANEGVWVIDPENNTTFANARMAEMLGYARDELLGRDLFTFMNAADRVEAEAIIQDQQESVLENHEFEFIRKDGTRLFALICTSALFDDDGSHTGALAMVSDITERVLQREEKQRLEVQVHQKERLESVGLLAGGIAHDFNNVLAVIENYAAFAQEEIESDTPAHRDIEQVRRAADRAAALTRQLLVFSRRDHVDPEVVSLNRVTEELVKLLGRTLGEHIELVLELEPDLWYVEADVSQLDQVLLNLAINSRDAMTEGGRLVVRTQNTTLDATDALREQDLAPGDYVRLTVSDTGTGISDENLRRAFDPFFTTKPKGEGTGLGLATVYGIVKQGHGHVRIYSGPGAGTVVSALLPRAAVTGEAKVTATQPTIVPANGETLLVVEDEEPVRELVCRILAKHGYRVLSAPDGPSALDVAERHEGPIDVLLSDVVMPHMLGPALAKALTEKRPDLQVIFMSGYTDRHDDLNAPLVEKPFRAEDLLRPLEDTLAKKR